MRQNKFLAALLAAIMVFSMLPAMIFSVSADEVDYPGVLFNNSPNYVAVGTTNTVLYADTYTTEQEEGIPGITLWLNVRNVTEPVYIGGFRFAFKTAAANASGADSFDSQNTSGTNLRNSKFKVEADGDYLLYIPLDGSLAWNYVAAENKGLKSVSNITARAFLASDETVASEAEVALMGIFEGQVDLSESTTEYFDADKTTSLASKSPAVATIEPEAYFYDGKKGNQNANYIFQSVADGFTAPEKEDWRFLEWVDANGNHSLAGVVDALYAVYESTAPDINGYLLAGRSIINQESAGTWDENGMDTAHAFDGDFSTYWKCAGLNKNADAAKNQYIGYDFARTANIQTVVVKTNICSTSDGGAGDHSAFGPSTWIEFSEDGQTWVRAYELADTDEKQVVYAKDFSEDVAGMDVKYARVNRTIEKDPNELLRGDGKKYWHTFSVYELQFYGSVDMNIEQQAGYFFDDSEPVAINQSNGDTAPEEQTLWEGVAELNGADGVTFVYKLEGVNSPIYANNFVMTVKPYGASDANVTSNYGNWIYPQPAWGNTRFADLVFEGDGYYYLYLNQIGQDGNAFGSIENFRIFNTARFTESKLEGYDLRQENKNENATFQMLAIVERNLMPTLIFCDEDGTPIAEPYTYQYTNASGTVWTTDAKKQGKLLSADEIFAASGIAAPTKESGIANVEYQFKGWVDEDGNPVDVVYTSGKVYASYEKIDNRPIYKVSFVDEDGTTVLQEVDVREGDLPEFAGTPKKPSTDTMSWDFAGWEPELAAATANATYTAQFTECGGRKYDVVFMGEDKTTVYGEVRTAVGGGAVTCPNTALTPDGIPVKEATEQFTYTFKGWVDANGNAVDLNDVKADITVYAAFDAIPNQLTVTFYSDDKETVIEAVKVNFGAAATAPTATKAADNAYTYTFDKWVDEDGNEADFSNVTADMNVYATFTATYVNKFTDVDMNRWYASAVEYAVANNLMDGMSATTFEPNTQTTRGMLVTVLYRIEGKPSVADMDETPFTDVAAGRYYSDPIKWAYNNDVVEGMTDTEFAPEKIVTREQLATMVYRYADKVKNYNMDIGKLTTLGTFVDKNDISNYATTAVKWALDKEYIKGYKDGDDVYMKPKNGATRAEMMAVLMRFVEDEHKTK